MNAFHRNPFPAHPKDSLNGSKESLGPVANGRHIADPPTISTKVTFLSANSHFLSSTISKKLV
jgi:hypothetical protein